MGRFQLTGATVVDGSSRDPTQRTIKVENGRIVDSPDGDRIDVGGLTMTPGLIDAHVHLGPPSPIQPQFSFQVSAAEIAADIFAAAGLGEVVRERVAGARERMARALAVAREAGVRIGLGSDLIGPEQDCRGEELGLPDVGVITPGKQANLVLWNENALNDPVVCADHSNAVLIVHNGRVVKDLR